MGRNNNIRGIVSIGLRECRAIDVFRHDMMRGIQRISDRINIAIAINRLGNDVVIDKMVKISHSQIIAELVPKKLSAVCLMYLELKLRIDFCSV